MLPALAAYATVTIVMVAIDLLWIGVIARPLYQQGIGHLMAERPFVPAAVLFYAVYALGLMLFAVLPGEQGASWLKVAGKAALFGFFAYATYDLTNLATLKQWPVGLSLLDMVWGSLVSAVSAAAGKAVLDRLATG